MTDSTKMYGHILATIPLTDFHSRLNVRLNYDSDVLYILSYEGTVETFELGFTHDGKIIFKEERTSEKPDVVKSSKRLPSIPKYGYNDGKVDPVACSFCTSLGESVFTYVKTDKELVRRCRENIYIDFEVDIAIEMMKQGFLSVVKKVNVASVEEPA